MDPNQNTKDDETEVTSGGGVRMRKEVNLVSASAIMTGIIIGSGIFVSPVSFTKNCGSVGMSLIMWAVSAVVTLMVALCFNELGGIFPKSGGEYSFLKEVFGPLSAFVDAWMHLVMIQPSYQALLGLTTAEYCLQAFLPGSCNISDTALKLLTITVIVLVVAINSVYVKYVTRVQNVLTAIKILALVIIMITGIVQIAKGNTEHLKRGFEGTNTNPGAYAVAIHSGIFTYMGWQYIFCIMEEIKNPRRTVPLSTFFSLGIVSLLYIMTNVAYFTVMSPEEMIQSKAVAVLFAERTLGRFAVVIPILVALSTIGALNGCVFAGSRYYYAAARDGLFPSIMSMVHVKYLTPWPSLISVTIIAILYVYTGELVALVEYNGFGMTVMMLAGVCCMLYTRYQRPDVKRDIKVPLFIPIISAITLAGLVILGIVQKPRENGIAAIVVLVGIPVYLIFVRMAPSTRLWREKSRRFTIMAQKFLMTVSTDKDE